MTNLSPPAAPGPALCETSWPLDNGPLAPSIARDHARQALADWGMQRLVDEVALLVSELVTNAVVHAAAPVELRLHRYGHTVRVEVVDHGATWTVRRPAPLCDLAEGGRGLALVELLSARWGVDPLPGMDGKVVWATLAVPA
jgi:anti-sigma regulatory factor (Ser/Thr protein kinase)